MTLKYWQKDFNILYQPSKYKEIIFSHFKMESCDSPISKATIIGMFILLVITVASSLALIAIKIYRKFFVKKIDYIKNSSEIVKNALSTSSKVVIQEEETPPITSEDVEQIVQRIKDAAEQVSSLMANIKAIKPVIN